LAKKRRILRTIRKLVLWAILLFFGSSVFFAILYRFVPPPFTPLMLIRLAEQAVDGKPLRLKKDWVSLEKISPKLIQAVVAAEDNAFLDHYGFDLEAIKKAQEYNKKHKRKKGGSTISQQTAKNVFLWPRRSWFRKGLEVYFTGLIELFWGKKRIMEVYLNVIEMGNGIYGAEMASYANFKKPAARLTASEAALLAGILPNPRKFSASRPSSYTKRRQQRILLIMNQLEPVSFGK